MSTWRPAPARPAGARWLRAGLVTAVLGVLALVFALYTQPGFLVMLIDQLWSCF